MTHMTVLASILGPAAALLALILLLRPRAAISFSPLSSFQRKLESHFSLLKLRQRRGRKAMRFQLALE
jgi:hypothetical protein